MRPDDATLAIPGAPGIRRLRAPNPSPMTGDGTNTYLIGRGEVAIVDPGPAIAAHRDAILRAIGPGDRVAAILVTHAHLDHSALAPALSAATGAPVLAFGTARHGRSARMERLSRRGESGGEGVDHGFRPDRRLQDGERIAIGGQEVTALHTPGHMAGHLSFLAGDVLLTGDTAMGWSTSLVDPPDGDMGAYMRSLDRMIALAPRLLLPGHGPEVPDALQRLAWLRQHRLLREAQILRALKAGPADSTALAGAIYAGLAPVLLAAAARNVFAHLLDLEARNVVACAGTPGFRQPYRLT